MSEEANRQGWFHATDGVQSINSGQAPEPADWPSEAVETQFVSDLESYYEQLHEATVSATRQAIAEREKADDQQLAEAVQAMDDIERRANELAERVAAWGGTLGYPDTGGIDGAKTIAEEEPSGPEERRVVSLAERVTDLAKEREACRQYVERTARSVAPNLAALAGPILAARLIALAGGLESLARMPSGTVQVLGAEDALFAHLRGDAPAPKHGVIYTHEAVSGTREEDRGSAARALAGKLTIAARVDHYAGDRRPSLKRELVDRIDEIQDREAEE